jgi:hypothetical protein
MLFGHLAIVALQHRYLKTELVPTAIAGLFPDLVDKTLCQVLHLTPSGRMLGHTLLGLALSTVAAGLSGGKKRAWSWALGYAGHLLGDLGGPVPWLYPFVPYDFPYAPSGLWEILRQGLSDRKEVAIELALVAWAILALGWSVIQGRLPTPARANPPPHDKRTP